MGADFDSVEELRRTFPKYATEDAIRAIRAGAKTPMEVERFCFARRNARSDKRRAGTSASGYRVSMKGRQPKKVAA